MKNAKNLNQHLLATGENQSVTGRGRKRHCDPCGPSISEHLAGEIASHVLFVIGQDIDGQSHNCAKFCQVMKAFYLRDTAAACKRVQMKHAENCSDASGPDAMHL